MQIQGKASKRKLRGLGLRYPRKGMFNGEEMGMEMGFGAV